MRVASTILLLVSILYLLFIHHFDARDLWSSHEARAAQNAQTIRDTGDWLLPRLYDGRSELQKPPLYYWLVAGISRLRGMSVDAWAVRLPAALAAILTVATLWMLGWRLGRPTVGIVAALLLAMMCHFTWLGRVGRIDVPLTLATTVALAGFYVALRQPAHFSFGPGLVVSYLAIAAGVLLKGPIAMVVPAVVVGVHVFGENLWRNHKCLGLAHRLGLWWGIPLVLALTVPWFWLANERTDGELLRTFLWKHNVERGLGGDPDLEANPDAFWFYLVRLGPDLFPWSLLLPVALIVAIRQGFLRDDPEARFGLTWFVGLLVFFSLVRFKRADYLVPAYPGAALFLGAVVERWLNGASQRARRIGQVALATLVAVTALAWVACVDWYFPRQEAGRELRTFASEVRRYVPRPGQVIVFRAESHLLAYHLGKPFERIIEWENLDVWAVQPATVYVVLTESDFLEWEKRLEVGRLRWITSTSTLAGGPHDQPLVLCATEPPDWPSGVPGGNKQLSGR